jgi:hypothetical protein
MILDYAPEILAVLVAVVLVIQLRRDRRRR